MFACPFCKKEISQESIQEFCQHDKSSYMFANVNDDGDKHRFDITRFEKGLIKYLIVRHLTPAGKALMNTYVCVSKFKELDKKVVFDEKFEFSTDKPVVNIDNFDIDRAINRIKTVVSFVS